MTHPPPASETSTTVPFARALIKRFPWAEELGLGLSDALLRLALLPFRRRQRRSPVPLRSAGHDEVDAYNQAAEAYFDQFVDADYLIDKPYSDGDAFAEHLVNAGVLIGALKIQPGSTVLELGAGSCWLSHLLNRYGCRTLAVDVSRRALTLGHVRFQSDSRTRWNLEPEFVGYDGYTLPFDSGSVDYVVVHDAFHHIPNQVQILKELARVLGDAGIVGMSEPGLGHGSTEHSLAEASTAGVLENELYLSDLTDLALRAGFARATVVIAGANLLHEVDAQALPAFMGGAGVAPYWKRLCSALERHHYLLLHKSDRQRSTRRPGTLSALFSWQLDDMRVAPEDAVVTAISVTNTGDTVWLASEGLGWTRLGLQLESESGQLLDRDWARIPLPHDVPPGDTVGVDVVAVAPRERGTYLITADMVVERVVWFAQHGSASAARRRLDVL